MSNTNNEHVWQKWPVEQLWYTWSQQGFGATTGYRVRAASENLIQNGRVTPLERYLSYYLPQGADASALALNPDKAPLSLALLETPQGRILVQKAFTGKDLVGRPSAFFSHLLTNLPADYTAKDAIRLWRSRFWKRDDKSLDSTSRKLEPEFLDQLMPGELPTSEFESLQEFLPLVIQAFLFYGEHLSLFILAPSDKVAALIWGLSCSLPRLLISSLTFSTYEQNLNALRERLGRVSIVGTDTANIQQDLPAFCTTGGNLAINYYARRVSPLPTDETIADFAQFATRYWLGSTTDRLDVLVEKADRLHIDTRELFLFLYKLFAGKSLTQADLLHFLGKAELVAELLTEVNLQEVLIREILLDRQGAWWHNYAQIAFEQLRDQATPSLHPHLVSTLAAFAQRVTGELRSTLEQDREDAFERLLAVLKAATPLSCTADVGLTLLHELSDKWLLPKLLRNWSIRSKLLEYWGSLTPQIEATTMGDWLVVSWRELDLLGRLTLPQSWYTYALVKLLNTAPPRLPAEAKVPIQRFAPHIENLLRLLLLNASEWSRAIHYFDTLVQSGFFNKMRLLVIMLAPKIRDLSYVEAMLSAAQLSSSEYMALLDSTEGEYLLKLPKMPNALLNFVQTYVESIQGGMLEQADLQRLLQALDKARSSLPVHLSSLIQGWNEIVFFMQQPALSRGYLENFSKALRAIPAEKIPAVKARVLPLFVRHITEVGELHLVLSEMVPVLAPTRATLLEQILRTVRTAQPSGQTLGLYVRAVIEEGQQMNQSQQTATLLTVLLEGAPRESYDQIDREARKWESLVRQDWTQYAMEHRPFSSAERRKYNQAVSKAKKALETRQVGPIARAWDDLLRVDEQLSKEEYNQIILAYNFVVAYEDDDDQRLLKAVENIAAYKQKAFFRLTAEESRRVALAQQRLEALKRFRAALQTGNVKQIVDAYDPLLSDYKACTAQEGNRYKLATRLLDAYEQLDLPALAETYANIQRMGYEQFFTFTPQERQRIQLALGHVPTQQKSSSKSIGEHEKERGTARTASASEKSTSTHTSNAASAQSPGQTPIAIVRCRNAAYAVPQDLYVCAAKVKEAYLNYKIYLLELRIKDQPSTKELSRQELKKLKAQSKPDKLPLILIEELIDDALIQHGIKQLTAEGLNPDIFTTHLQSKEFDNFKTYIWNTAYQKLYQQKEITDKDVEDHLLLNKLRESAARFLGLAEFDRREWEIKCQEQFQIDYSDTYHPDNSNATRRLFGLPSVWG